MAKPSPMQTYSLVLIWFFRVLGAVYGLLAGVVTVANLPGLLRDGNGSGLWIALLGGVGNLAFGVLIYLGATWILRRYRAHVAAQVD